MRRRLGRSHPAVLAWIFFVVAISAIVGLRQAPSSRQGSDAFWQTAFSYESVSDETFETLPELAQASDLIVVGAIERVEAGRTFLADPQIAARGTSDPYYDEAFAYYANAGVRVGQVIAGDEGLVGQLLPLEIFATQKGKLDLLLGAPVFDGGLFFLRSKGKEAASLGLSPAEQAAEAPYYRLTTARAVLRDFSGTTAALPGSDPYLAALDNRSFADVVALVEAAAPAVP